MALLRNNVYPGNVVSWRFQAPATEQSVAILVPSGTPDYVKIVAYNLEDKPVTAALTGWEVDPGTWEITQGTSAADETAPLQNVLTRTAEWERSRSVDVTFAPRTTTVIEMKRMAAGVPYWMRADLGIGPEDVNVDGTKMRVTVHSLGAEDAPAARVVLRDKAGKVLASAKVPPLKAPVDLEPKTHTVSLSVPAGAEWKGGSVSVEMSGPAPEITLMNNRVEF